MRLTQHAAGVAGAKGGGPFGAERAVREGRPKGRTSKAKRCSARRAPNRPSWPAPLSPRRASVLRNHQILVPRIPPYIRRRIRTQRTHYPSLITCHLQLHFRHVCGDAAVAFCFGDASVHDGHHAMLELIIQHAKYAVLGPFEALFSDIVMYGTAHCDISWWMIADA